MSFILLGILNSQVPPSGAGGSYDLLETTLISSNTASVTFSNLNTFSAYKHLQLRITARASTSGDNNSFLRFNADTGSNYREHALYGDGSSVFSFADSLGNALYIWSFPQSSSTANIFGGQIIDILDFSSTNKNTTIRALAANGASNQIALTSGVWLNTTAVTSLTVLTGASNNYAPGTRMSLYGIK
jgi:hypothetical protein